MALVSTRRLMVLGDSFAAGSGVEDYRDRFANILGTELGKGWTAIVVAMPGWNTVDEAEALERFPYPPQVLVLSVYLNDIEGAAAYRGEVFRPNVSIHPRALQRLVEGSSLANFVFWRLATSRFWSDAGEYADWIYGRFADDPLRRGAHGHGPADVPKRRPPGTRVDSGRLRW
jgi:hypothetical protein